MSDSFLGKLEKIPRFWLLLAALVILGIFLRTWHHHDWLRFNADQGRDAALVSAVIDNVDSWPLLGPKAGGTEFRLGPAFYYFEIISAKFFGNAPDKMAFPDLLSSVLAIPLLFFFLKKYFDHYISLALTTIFSVSAYAIFYSRFAWNPNSLPFWTMLFLYALHEIVSSQKNRKDLWAIVAGAALGVAVQLHTTMLVILPITTIAVFIFFAMNDKKILKYFLIVLAVALLFNGSQLASEYQTKGQNIRAFFGGLKIKNQVESSVFENAARDASCFVEANSYILSGYVISDGCSFRWGKHSNDTWVFFLGALFVFGGIVLGLKDFFKELNRDRRIFLGIVFTFFGISFLIYWKMAQELSVRFYLPLIFFPFFLLGFWFRLVSKKILIYWTLMPTVTVLLIVFNLFFVQRYFTALADYAKPGGGSVEVMILKEAEIFSQFIIDGSPSPTIVYITGDTQFLFKGFKSLKYLVDRSGINLTLANDQTELPDQYFLIVSLTKRQKMINFGKIDIIREASYGDFAIMLVQNI